MALRSVQRDPSFRRAAAALSARPGAGWLPEGLSRLDPTWLAAHPSHGPRRPPARAFAALPEPLRAVARRACGRAGSAETPPHADTLCEVAARWCWCDLVDLPPEAPDAAERLRAAAEAEDLRALARLLPGHSAERITALAREVGAAPLGRLLAQVPDRAAAAVCGRLDEPLRRRVWGARTDGGPAPTREQLRLLGPVTGASDAAAALFALGAQDLGALVGAQDRLALLQTAQLLPIPAARHLLATPGRALSAARQAEVITALSGAA